MTSPPHLPALAIVLAGAVAFGAEGTRPAAVQPTADGVLDAYVTALGGEAAIQRIETRVVRGRFDNGRGLKAPFVVYAKAPNKLVTFIGTDTLDGKTGSGRGFDGQAGWDKDFIGTGLRSVSGVELADLRRDADIRRSLHLKTHCPQRTLEAPVALDGASAVVLRCGLAEGRTGRFYFDASSGLLLRYDSESWTGEGFVSIYYEDYRVVDGLRLAFRTRSRLPGAVTTFTVETVRHNEPVDDRIFARPRQGLSPEP